jgi:hypothetical protein
MVGRAHLIWLILVLALVLTSCFDVSSTDGTVLEQPIGRR